MAVGFDDNFFRVDQFIKIAHFFPLHHCKITECFRFHWTAENSHVFTFLFEEKQAREEQKTEIYWENVTVKQTIYGTRRDFSGEECCS